MIKSKQMQHGGMQIMHAGAVLLCAKTELVGCTMNGSAFDSPASHPDCETIMIVVPSEF